MKQGRERKDYLNAMYPQIQLFWGECQDFPENYNGTIFTYVRKDAFYLQSLESEIGYAKKLTGKNKGASLKFNYDNETGIGIVEDVVNGKRIEYKIQINRNFNDGSNECLSIRRIMEIVKNKNNSIKKKALNQALIQEDEEFVKL